MSFVYDGKTYPTVKYVEEWGSDSNPGTVDLPYRSFTKAYDSSNVGGLILLGEGEFQSTIRNSGYNLMAIVYFSKNITVIGTPLKSIVYGRGTGQIYYGVALRTDVSTTVTVKNVIFRAYDCTVRFHTGDNSPINSGYGFNGYGYFYNCVYDFGAIGNTSHQNGGQMNHYNCLFTRTRLDYINRGYSYHTFNQCAFTTEFNSNYWLSSLDNSSIGVYSGSLAWIEKPIHNYNSFVNINNSWCSCKIFTKYNDNWLEPHTIN